MSRPHTPNPSAVVSRSSVSRQDRKPILPGPISRSARASANLQSTLNPNVKDIPMVELGGKKSLLQSFTSLTPNIRIALGLVVGAVGIAGLMIDRNVLQDEQSDDKNIGVSVRMVDRK